MSLSAETPAKAKHLHYGSKDSHPQNSKSFLRGVNDFEPKCISLLLWIDISRANFPKQNPSKLYLENLFRKSSGICNDS